MRYKENSETRKNIINSKNFKFKLVLQDHFNLIKEKDYSFMVKIYQKNSLKKNKKS